MKKEQTFMSLLFKNDLNILFFTITDAFRTIFKGLSDQISQQHIVY